MKIKKIHRLGTNGRVCCGLKISDNTGIAENAMQINCKTCILKSYKDPDMFILMRDLVSNASSLVSVSAKEGTELLRLRVLEIVNMFNETCK